MSTTVCLLANTLSYPAGGGHLWVYLNWALGLRANGCDVIWMEGVAADAPTAEAGYWVCALQDHLRPYGLGSNIALCSHNGEPLPSELASGCLDLAAAAEADLLLNFNYGICQDVPSRFRRSALVDIDPGLLQLWMHEGWINVAAHDVYFTTGETVGRTGGAFPDGGKCWVYTPPCVALEWWPVREAVPGAPFTTISHWSEDRWLEDGQELYRNDKRTGFLPYIDLPSQTSQALEVALYLAPSEEDDRKLLQASGWRLADSHVVASTPGDYQRYIQESRGEFSWVKPSCIRLQNAWVSDRTLCYLASGKPAVVENTGPSRILPDAEGMFRFRNLEEAVAALDAVAADYEHQAMLARALAEHYFDAAKVAGTVLERALA